MKAHDGTTLTSRPTSSGPEADLGTVEKSSTSSKNNKSSNAQEETQHQAVSRSRWQRFVDVLYWTPPNCRWDPDSPPKFSTALNVLFAFAGAFTVANLYYNHPILNILAKDFGVDYVEVSQIPTLAQAGYAVGLFFLCPLGDLFKRRPFVLSLIFVTATLCIGLCTTTSIRVFSAIQFLVAITTVTPQLMMPLVGDLAPPARRATALSIVGSGLMLGILIARLLSGVVTQYTSWRTIYYLSVGLQYLIFALLWCFMPDYPSTNPDGLNYFHMLWSMILMLTKHPVLVQACGIAFFVSATFTNFWTNVTFLLSSPPYNYDSVIIGLFALIGIASMLCSPFYAKLVIDRFVPLFTVLLGIGWCLIGITLGTYTGTFTVAGPILQAWFGDFGMQTSQISLRSSIFTVEPKARNRTNTAFMVFTFFGQLVGTSVGAKLYERGGWTASGSFSVGSMGMALVVVLLRGPWEEGWAGWHGGWSVRKKSKDSADGKTVEVRGHLMGRERVDVEKGKDEHEHRHGRDDQEAVNSTDAEKSLEMMAAEDVVDWSSDKTDIITTEGGTKSSSVRTSR
ncbi:putative major facilitator superfamily transporter [Zymoseptoria tritici IPO323]|uniref:Major facilitator superfamily transporter n=1 Tax=Zymoseptoria tritici (strain CBS 115943 / IPO323) TaxID=336722 RepID=F9X6W5_ZYMTI|nr:putative major facilitator superfamily transporter [Zymoseptoria tritici IPO323]EGP89334.1 putative major facilitator superfamily transporter [Zymoseptoria tritici IPO323]